MKNIRMWSGFCMRETAVVIISSGSDNLILCYIGGCEGTTCIEKINSMESTDI